MKKHLIAALFVLGLGATFTACTDQKKAQETEQAATELTDSVKEKAKELFKSVHAERMNMLNEVVVTKDGVKTMPVKFFLALDMADKAQTNYEKNQLLGIYLADKETNDFVFVKDANNAKERAAVIAKLVAETNKKYDVAAVDSLSKEEMISMTDSLTAQSVEEALENNTADEMLINFTYAVIESTLNKIGVAEMVGEYDQQEIFKDILGRKDMLANIVELYNLLKPYYKSLEEMAELAEKIDAVVKADEATADEALGNFITFCKEHRGKIAAY
ncbi:MAG: hypothetical protein MJZ32_06335 [Bacteroidaceae bacterium]|nr:hypothetical protein [Bacteroidaceae bacterium]